MVRVNDAWAEGVDGGSGLALGHGIWQVEADEGHIDVFQVTHFRDVLGVATDIDAGAAEGDDIAIAAPLVMELQAVLRQVVHGNGFDIDADPVDVVAVAQHERVGLQRGGQLFVDGDRGDDPGVTGNSRQGGGIEMVAMDIRDQDQVGALDAVVEGGAAYRVDVDGFAVPFHDKRGMGDRVNGEVAVIGRHGAAGQELGLGSGGKGPGQHQADDGGFEFHGLPLIYLQDMRQRPQSLILPCRRVNAHGVSLQDSARKLSPLKPLLTAVGFLYRYLFAAEPAPAAWHLP